MRGSIVALGLVLLACGPQVALDGEATEGGSGGEGDGSPATGISGDATGPGTSLDTSVGDVDVDDGTIIDDLGRHPGCGDGIDTRDEMCLEPGPTVPIDGTPVGVAAGDIDGDGIDEVLVSTTGGPPLVVARVANDGIVLEPHELPMDAQVPVTVGDLDDDGRADIAAAVPAPPAVVVGYGPDLDALTVPIPVDFLPSVTYARNETGSALLLETRRPTGAALEVMVPSGNGGFELVGTSSALGETHLGANSLSRVTPIPRGPGYACASALAMTYDFSIDYELRLDIDLGTEMPAETVSPLLEEPLAIAVGEVDGDELLDVFVARSDSVARYTATSVVHFVGSVGKSGTISLAVGDFDGDGLDDLAGGMETGELFVSVAWTAFPAGESFLPSDAFPHSIAAGDFDGNGRDDLAVVDDAGLLALWLNHP